MKTSIKDKTGFKPAIGQVMQSGIPQGQYNVIIGKSRQTGKSYYNMSHLRQYLLSVRKEKLKNIIDSI